MRFKKPKIKAAKDIVRSTPKSTHLKSGKTPKSMPKTTHPGSNLGSYLHKSKLPTGAKVGVGKIKKPRKSSNKVKGY